jgi:HK97 family phage major capsid protein
MNPEQIRARIRELLAQRATHEQALTAALAVLRGDNVTDQQRADATSAASAARAAIVPLDEQLDEQQTALRAALDQQTRDANAAALRAELGNGDDRRQNFHVEREQRTYSAERDRRGEASFFVDAFRSQMMGDIGARQRLERHMAEVAAEGEHQTRAVSTGSFAGLVVPQYLIGLAARVMRSGRPVANVVARLPLPDQGMTLSIPRGTTGAAVASQATENSALQNTDEVWQDLTIPVATIGGQQDVSRQSLERGTPGIDQLVYMDLAGAFHAEVDRQVIRGSGASGQLLGMLNTGGTAQSTAFGGALTGAALNTKVAGGVAAVSGVGIGVRPKVIVMHPRRWGYLISLSDTAGRPLVVPNAGAGSNVLAANTDPGGYSGGDDPGDFRQATPVGSMQGLPVITDANLPTNQGTNLEDVIVVFDNDAVLLWEDGDGMPRQLRFEQTLGQNLTTKLVAYGYAAFTAGRYPQAVAKIGGADTAAGNGLVAPTF